MALGVKKLFQHLDFQLHEMRNALLHKVAGDPGSPVESEIWYDDTANRAKYRTDAATKTLAHLDEVSAGMTFDDPIASAVGDTIDEGVDTDAARADHRHGREAFAAPVALTAFNVSTATGTATTVVHSDHVHGSPAHDASAHSAIKLSDLAVPTANISLNSNKLTAVTDGTADSDGATVGQMNALMEGLSWKDSVRAASTATVVIATALENGDSLDDVTLVTGDRVLLKNQSTASENGIYIVAATGAAARATDANTGPKLRGAAVMVDEGTANLDTAWYTSTDAITINTTSITFSPFPGFAAMVAGAGLTKTGNTVDVGAGTGITVAADAVGIDKTLVPIFKTGLVGGAGPATQYTVTNPGFAANARVSVVVTEESSGEQVEVGIQVESDGDIVVDFGISSVAGTAYRYMATGLAA